MGFLGSILGSVIGSIISAGAKLIEYFSVRKDEVDLGQKRQETADLRAKETQQAENIDLIGKANDAAKHANDGGNDAPDPNDLDATPRGL